MKNNDYWIQRSADNYLATEKVINKYYKELEQAYNQAKRDILDDINKFYGRYAKETGMSYTDALKKITDTELTDLNDYIAEVNKVIAGLTDNEKMLAQSYKTRITRLNSIVAEIDARLRELYVEFETKSEEVIKEIYEESYNRGMWLADTQQGFHASTLYSSVNDKALETLIQLPFDGASYSTRIWKQQAHLIDSIKQDLVTMLVQGKHPRTLAGSMSKRFKTKKYEAYRLLHTEHAFVVEQANMQVYKDLGVEKYQYLATLDNRTCKVCGRLDGKKFDLKDCKVGVNYPPMHPLCRCTTLSVLDDTEEHTRIARNRSNKNIHVPSTMTYEEWKKQFLD